jgi:hypothetical protein
MRFHQSARVGGKTNKKSNISTQKLFIIFIFMTDIQLTLGWFSPTTRYMSPYKIPHSVTLLKESVNVNISSAA